MNQQQIIEQLVREHHAMEQALSGLSPDRMCAAHVFDEWTVKDIVAHIAAWHWAVVQAIDDVLAGLMACVSLHVTITAYHITMSYLAR